MNKFQKSKVEVVEVFEEPKEEEVEVVDSSKTKIITRGTLIAQSGNEIVFKPRGKPKQLKSAKYLMR